jgi:hypothetical protein
MIKGEAPFYRELAFLSARLDIGKVIPERRFFPVQ